MNIQTFLKKSIKGKLSAEEQIKFLKAKKDLTAEELAKTVRFLESQMPKRPKLQYCIDICGTGGSGLKRINTSTISAFILAALDVGIAKHGNRAASGRFGSFDLLESLDIEFLDDTSKIEKIYRNQNLAFLFARFFHPVMKHFAQARKEIAHPTFFNILGPLLNPAFSKRQIIGTAFKDKMGLIAKACKLLGKEKVYVVCGENNLDEVTLTGKTYLTELQNGKIKSYTITPEDFGIKRATFKEIQGGDVAFNKKIALQIIQGKCKTRHLDLILVNVALALKLTNKVKTLKEGYELAKKAVENGLAFEKYEQIKTLSKTPSILLEIIEHKKLKPSERDFKAALKGPGLSVIAEIKKASPSEGEIAKQKFQPAKIARKYEQNGASAISVLCDKKFFKGDIKYLGKAANATHKTPLLCKDFITHEYQIYEARKHGADAILLIAAILTEDQIAKFIQTAKSLNMDALCEVHTLTELQKVLKTPAEIIGINNRDLHTFKIDLKTTNKLAKHIPKDKIIVSESGIKSKSDLKKFPKNINAVLIGTALMKGKSPSEFTKKKLKICGIRNAKEAKFCEKLGVDLIGLNFVPQSKRKVSIKQAKEITKAVKSTKTVGVFQNQSIEEVNKIAKELNLGYIQLAGTESIDFIKKCTRPVIKTIAIKNQSDMEKARKYLKHVAHIILDGPTPGSGKLANISTETLDYPFLIAGGISPKNVTKIVKTTNAIGVDVASGIETKGQIDPAKIQSIFNQLKSC